MQSCKPLCGSSDNANKDDFESTFAGKINLTELSVGVLVALRWSTKVELYGATERRSWIYCIYLKLETIVENLCVYNRKQAISLVSRAEPFLRNCYSLSSSGSVLSFMEPEVRFNIILQSASFIFQNFTCTSRLWHACYMFSFSKAKHS
jgi:hypothetical protein